MDIISLARELGAKIQAEECYAKFQATQKANDEDVALQEKIGEFNLKRMAINNEAQKADRSEQRLSELNLELRECYNEIMSNETMMAYEAANAELDALMQRILAIISKSGQGEDPETCDFDADACGGDCGSCGGCH